MRPLGLLSIVSLFMISISCKKGDSQKNELIPENKIDVPIIEEFKTTMNITDLFSTEFGIEEVFPGNVIRVDTLSAMPKITTDLAYTKLPVRWSTPNNIGTYDGLPSFKNLQDYIKPLEDKISQLSGIKLSSWQQIYDYRVIYNIFGMREDLDAFYKLFAIVNQPKMIEDGKTVIVQKGERILASVSASLPNKNEIILQNELDKLYSNGENLYYINHVNYGYIYAFVLEGEEPKDILLPVINNAFKNGKISAEEAKVLDKSKLVVYFRTGRSRQPFVKQALGSESILKLIKESNDQIKDYKGFVNYPINYTLRSLKHFNIFKYQFLNRAYFKK